MCLTLPKARSARPQLRNPYQQKDSSGPYCPLRKDDSHRKRLFEPRQPILNETFTAQNRQDRHRCRETAALHKLPCWEVLRIHFPPAQHCLSSKMYHSTHCTSRYLLMSTRHLYFALYILRALLLRCRSLRVKWYPE